MALARPVPSAASRAHRVEEITDPIAFAGLRAEWNALLRAGPVDMPFIRHEWIAAWLRHFAPTRGLRILVARNAAGEAMGIAPFLEQRRPLGHLWLTAPANDHSCRFEWVLGRDPAGAVAAIWAHLRDQLRWTGVLLRDLPRDGPTSTLLAAAAGADGCLIGRWESMCSPYLSLGMAPVASRISAKHRRNLERRGRNLGGRGAVAYEMIDGADGLDESLAAFFALEGAGWKGSRGTAIAGDPRLFAFYTEVASVAAEQGWLSMRALRLEGRPAAIHFGLTYRGTYYLPKAAYDESLGHCSPGQLLMREVLAECEGRRLSAFDFLGPSMAWKRDWAALHRPHDWLYLYRPSALGALLHTMRHRLRPIARAAVRESREALSWIKH
jgi:CelD/BcsL family acetyltransferase involved in cellulose biosynthesis